MSGSRIVSHERTQELATTFQRLIRSSESSIELPLRASEDRTFASITIELTGQHRAIAVQAEGQTTIPRFGFPGTTRIPVYFGNGSTVIFGYSEESTSRFIIFGQENSILATGDVVTSMQARSAHMLFPQNDQGNQGRTDYDYNSAGAIRMKMEFSQKPQDRFSQMPVVLEVVLEETVAIPIRISEVFSSTLTSREFTRLGRIDLDNGQFTSEKPPSGA